MPTLIKANLGVGQGSLGKVISPRALYGVNNDVELIGELMLHYHPDL